MKIIASLLLIALLVSSNGCMSTGAVQRAEGHTSEWVVVEKTDKVVEHDGICTVTRENPPKGEKAEIRFIRYSEVAGGGGYAYRPNPAYYALLPLTVPLDIVTGPFQLLYFWGADWGTP
jgi:hypothetical protein